MGHRAARRQGGLLRSSRRFLTEFTGQQYIVDGAEPGIVGRTAEQEAHRTGVVSNVLGNLHRMPAARSITTEVCKSVRLLIDPGRADQAGSNAAMVLTYRTKVSVTPVRR